MSKKKTRSTLLTNCGEEGWYGGYVKIIDPSGVSNTIFCSNFHTEPEKTYQFWVFNTTRNYSYFFLPFFFVVRIHFKYCSVISRLGGRVRENN